MNADPFAAPATDQTPGPGHNRPPMLDFYKEQNETLPAYLEAESVDILKRYEELTGAYDRAPLVVDSAEINAKFTDFVNKKIASLRAAIKGAHGLYKAPFLEGGRIVDAFYKRRDDRLADIQTELRKRQTAWNLKVEADKRRAAEEAARIARAAQEEAERIAAEERRKAEAARQEQERALAEERRKREAAEAETKRLADAAAAKIKSEKDLAKAIELEAAEKRRQEAAAEQRRKDEAAEAARQAERDAAAKTAAEDAERRRVEAEEAAKAALAKSTDLTRSRGDQGGVSSLRSEWKGEVEDREILDLETLREHFTVDGLNDAIKSYVKSTAPKKEGVPGPTLKGARIWLRKFTR